MTAEYQFGPWLAWNATDKSTCPADAMGKRVEFDWLSSSGYRRDVNDANRIDWTNINLLRYRVMIEPERGEVVKYVDDQLLFYFQPDEASTHRLTLPTLDGALIPGTYTGPDGAVIKVEAV